MPLLIIASAFRDEKSTIILEKNMNCGGHSGSLGLY